MASRLNLDQYKDPMTGISLGRLLEDYSVGAVVTTSYYPSYRWIVKHKIPDVLEPSGWSVSVAACTGTPDDIYPSKWICASEFWPVRAGVMIPVTISISNKKTIDHWPHKCPKCKGKAFIGFNQIDCMAGCYNLKRDVFMTVGQALDSFGMRRP